MAAGRIPRALLVDDRPDARERAAAELRRVLPHVKLEVAATREETLRLLDRLDGGMPGRAAADPVLFAVLRDGMAWGEGMTLPHAVRNRIPQAPLILTCDPTAEEAPDAAQDPAKANRVARREGLGEAITIAGDNVPAIAAAAEACLHLDRVAADRDRLAADRDRLREERDRLRADRRRLIGQREAAGEKVNSLLRAGAKSAEVEAADRRRLALVLHEDMLQMLVAARMFLACGQSGAAAASDSDCGDGGGGGPLAEVDALLVRSVQLCKDLTGLWSPLVLYEAGLVAALRWLGDATREPSGTAAGSSGSGSSGSGEPGSGPIPGPLVAEVDCDDDAEPDTQDGRTLLYQAAVELLTNAARHAGVDRARLSLRRVRTGPDEPDLLSLTVSDEGRGFDAPAEAAAGGPEERTPHAENAASDRFGLFSLAERLRLAGGRMEIESVAGRGTTVRLLCPVDAGRFTQRPMFADPDAAVPSPPTPAGAAAAPPPDGAAVRVLLADDHRIIRMSLSGLLGRAPGVEVVGEAADGEEALRMAHDLQPDVVLMDVTMPTMDGVESTRRIKEAWPRTRVIALSMHESDDRERDMFEAGAERYVVKDGPPELLLRAVLSPA